jgi:hypothetical protein
VSALTQSISLAAAHADPSLPAEPIAESSTLNPDPQERVAGQDFSQTLDMHVFEHWQNSYWCVRCSRVSIIERVDCCFI